MNSARFISIRTAFPILQALSRIIASLKEERNPQKEDSPKVVPMPKRPASLQIKIIHPWGKTFSDQICLRFNYVGDGNLTRRSSKKGSKFNHEKLASSSVPRRCLPWEPFMPEIIFIACFDHRALRRDCETGTSAKIPPLARRHRKSRSQVWVLMADWFPLPPSHCATTPTFFPFSYKLWQIEKSSWKPCVRNAIWHRPWLRVKVGSWDAFRYLKPPLVSFQSTC